MPANRLSLGVTVALCLFPLSYGLVSFRIGRVEDSKRSGQGVTLVGYRSSVREKPPSIHPIQPKQLRPILGVLVHGLAGAGVCLHSAYSYRQISWVVPQLSQRLLPRLSIEARRTAPHGLTSALRAVPLRHQP